MDLILWRHAEAQVAREGQDDLGRTLTAKGERQAQRMAEWLNQRLAQTTRVLASPAVRCQQTVRALDRNFRTLPSLAPGADAAAVLQAARWPGGSEPVLVVGHQPTLGAVAALLLGGQDAAWPVKKAAVWWLRQRERDGQLQVLLQAVVAPDFL